ncbi:uncharacterized protein DUF4168 [Hephaestia caeni]|uniref:Uncharacterized protein DUF4168 n=1 Tax=Hephaestia caeni TaxID=645617 RepID=A0A397NM37_9SPHN|nr:DUF4168 domain-containing protein [Hephaestia caeni]RIA36659.1 uncharacterized protein DUF4168 [Hephaestia caeni]
MKTLLKTAMLTGACMIAAPALAQTTPADPAAPQQTDPSMQADPAMTPQAADPAQAPQTTEVSDAEVDQFASAAVEVQKIGSDTAVAEDAKQEKMAAAVQSSGLSAERFNQIAQASQADPALQARIQTAAQSKMKPAS